MNRFKGLTTEERVLCVTTIDREICEIIRNDFCKRQRQANSISAPMNGLDKLQTLLFLNQPRQQNQWEFSIEDRSQKNGSNKAKKLDEQQPPKAFFSTVEASKKRSPPKFLA